MDDVQNQPPAVPQPPSVQVEATNVRTESVPIGSDGRLHPQPASVPPAAPQPAQAPQPAPPTDQPRSRSGFDPDKADGFIEKWGDDAISYFRDRLGVTKIEAEAARARAQAKYQLTDEQAAAIPGQTADEISRAADFAASLRTPNAGQPTPAPTEPETQPAPTQQVLGAPLPKVEREPRKNPRDMTNEEIFDPGNVPREWID